MVRVAMVLALLALPGASSGVCAAGKCCRVCSAGKACGDSCIARNRVCHKTGGCACDG